MKITNVLTAIAAPLAAAAVLGVGVAIGAQTAAVGEPAPTATAPAECQQAIAAADEAIAAADEYATMQELRVQVAAGAGEGSPERVEAETAEVAELFRTARDHYRQAAGECSN